MNRVYFKFYETKLFYKFLLVMEKKTSKVVTEIIKAILYALLGLLGGSTVM